MASRPSSDPSNGQSPNDPQRPSDHFDTPAPTPDAGIVQPRLGFVGTLRFFWRQLTSMRTALFLLLLVAFAAVPGSLVPQITSDPNGVVQYKQQYPQLSQVLDFLGVFNTYSSVWFSAIYLLLFISLVGCIIPRTKHHFDALRSKPPKTPVRLDRLAGYAETQPADGDVAAGITAAQQQLRRAGYRTRVFDGSSVSAERGYLRETGNLVFHMALVGILIAVGVGGGFIWTAQRVVIEGNSYVNTAGNYDSITPGRWWNPDALSPYKLKLSKLAVKYSTNLQQLSAYGEPIDFTAYVTTTTPGHKPQNQIIKVNSPLRIGDTDVYLLGNGYAPSITVRNPAGKVVFTGPVPFLSQDENLTSTGVVKVPLGLKKQVALLGLFLPTACQSVQVDATSKTDCGPLLNSIHPDLLNPVMSLQVFTGDLGLNKGKPVNAFTLDETHLKMIAGRGSGKAGLTLKPGKSVELPDGLGSISLGKTVLRYASLDIHHDPTQLWVLTFAILVFLGLITGLFVPRRRVWIKAVSEEGGIRYEYAGLARGEDPRLAEAVAEIARRHSQQLGLTMKP